MWGAVEEGGDTLGLEPQLRVIVHVGRISERATLRGVA
jgi:hypothetical protein